MRDENLSTSLLVKKIFRISEIISLYDQHLLCYIIPDAKRQQVMQIVYVTDYQYGLRVSLDTNKRTYKIMNKNGLDILVCKTYKYFHNNLKFDIFKVYTCIYYDNRQDGMPISFTHNHDINRLWYNEARHIDFYDYLKGIANAIDYPECT